MYVLSALWFRATRFRSSSSHSPFWFSRYLQRARSEATAAVAAAAAAAEEGSFGPQSRLKTSAVSPLCKSVSSQRAGPISRRRPHICRPSHRCDDNSQTSREISLKLRPNPVTASHQSSHSCHALRCASFNITWLTSYYYFQLTLQ